MEEKKGIEVSGIVVPADWDGEGAIRAWAVAVPGEKEFLIEAGQRRDTLARFARQSVTVRGWLKKSRGRPVITVTSIRVQARPETDHL